jgi:hypothetical protein
VNPLADSILLVEPPLGLVAVGLEPDSVVAFSVIPMDIVDVLVVILVPRVVSAGESISQEPRRNGCLHSWL